MHSIQGEIASLQDATQSLSLATLAPGACAGVTLIWIGQMIFDGKVLMIVTPTGLDNPCSGSDNISHVEH